ncbi:MAG TPA: universal stress protein [Roseiflexaceae bacterium]|nr:universal stress protein [Roseiflexaceae bacterium]
MKTILVPLDGSALAEQTLPYVRMLAPLLGATIHVLRVIPDDEKNALLASDPAVLREAEATGAPLWEREAGVWDMLRQRAEGYLDAQTIALRTAGFDVRSHVQIGAPAEMISAVAEQIHADLIAMATHGYTGFKRWTLGSVTDKVVQAATTPVFVVPGSATPVGEPQLKRILLPLDGSAFARQALPLATEIAVQACAELLLFQAVLPSVETFHGALLPADAQNMLRDHAREELRALAGELRPYEVPVKTVVVIGYPAEEIVEAAARHQVDLIVMATHGYGGIKRWALGGVADKVLHATPTPLLLVRPRAGEA